MVYKNGEAAQAALKKLKSSGGIVTKGTKLSAELFVPGALSVCRPTKI